VFSAFGTVQKIAIFEKNGQTQALIQYPGINHIQLLVLELVDCVPFLYIFLKCILLDGSILILLYISFFYCYYFINQMRSFCPNVEQGLCFLLIDGH